MRWLPGAVFFAYLVGTVLLFYFGPWHYPVRHHDRLLTFLVAAHAAFALGYATGVRGTPRASRWRVDPRVLALLCIAVDLALLFPTSHHNTGSWIPPIWDALENPGQAYRETLRLQHEKVPYVNYVRMLLAPLLASALPLGIFYWRSLGRWGRIALVTLVVGTLGMFVSMGTNRGVGEWATLFPWFVCAGHVSGVLPLDRRSGTAAAIIGVANFAVLFLFFGATMYTREGAAARAGRLASIGAVSEIVAARPQPNPPAAQAPAPVKQAPAPVKQAPAPVKQAPTPVKQAPTPAKQAPTPAKQVPAPAEQRPTPAERRQGPQESAIKPAIVNPALVTVAGLTSYFTQGYYAVYLSLDEPFVPMWGIGHSLFLQRQAARLTGNSAILERSYPERIEAKGWNAARSWATIYPWIASDVGFPGTVVVVFLIGYLLGSVWVDALGGKNPWAVALLGQILLMLYFFPANNRCLSTGEGVVAFGVLLPLWWLSRRGVSQPAKEHDQLVG